MARPRAFDQDLVLTNVASVFRKLGYQRCTIRDLETASGLSSGSLYNAYEDKPGLFQAACDHYLRTVLDQRVEAYAPPGSGFDGLRNLFLSVLEEPNEEAYGCLITNSAVEFGRTETPDIVGKGLENLRSTFADRIGGNAEGADALLAFYQGVLVRAEHDKQALERMISALFDSFCLTLEKE